MKGIVKYLVDNPRPTDDEIHAWAEENGHTPEEVEEYLYALIADVMKKFSKAIDEPDDKYDADELKRGIEVEKEHTDNPDLAEMIAKDHLNEVPNYYTLLDKYVEKKNVKARVMARLARSQ